MPESKEPAETGVVTFGSRKELDPDEQAAYLKKIADAKAKGGGVNAIKGATPLGHIERPQIPFLQKSPKTDQAPAGLSPTGGVQPRPAGSPILSPQTAAQLEDMQRVQGQQIAEEVKAEAEKEKKDDQDLFEMFDFYGRNEAERILNNKKRRQAIEEKLPLMNFQDLLMLGEVKQDISIRDGYTITLRSMLPSESLFVKRFIAQESQTTEAYISEKYALCQMAMALVAINGKEFGAPHMKEDGEVDEKIFMTKLKKVLKMSGYITADLGIQYAWFDVRVRKLLNPDDLGNG